MSELRFKAIIESQKRTRIHIEEKGRRSEQFGSNVFNESKMLQHLTKDALASVRGYR